jgi:putative sigma-54 modulation protein
MIPVRIQGIHGGREGMDEVGAIERSYRFALDRFVHSIREVEVWCADTNGPKGGIDKTCRVQIRLYPRGMLTAKSVGGSFSQAARDACEKVRGLLVKKLSKRRSVQRK